MEGTVESPSLGLCVVQPVDGFRYSAESFWLTGLLWSLGSRNTWWTLVREAESSRDYLLRTEFHLWDWTFDECEPYWQQTLRKSACATNLRLLVRDVSDVSLRPTPLVVANPPFSCRHWTWFMPNPWKRAARTEVHGGLLSFIETAARTVRPLQGRICFAAR